MAKKTFSIDQIEAYQKLKKRQLQLQRWQASIADEMAKLERQKRHQGEELDELEKRLKSEFRYLEAHGHLFVVSDVPDTALDEIGTKYITHEKKVLLLDRCIQEYKAIDPESVQLPFRWLKEHLASKYSIKCRSVSQFFKTVWTDRSFGGGNKNRYLVLDD